jgi:hypothetical protein
MLFNPYTDSVALSIWRACMPTFVSALAYAATFAYAIVVFGLLMEYGRSPTGVLRIFCRVETDVAGVIEVLTRSINGPLGPLPDEVSRAFIPAMVFKGFDSINTCMKEEERDIRMKGFGGVILAVILSQYIWKTEHWLQRKIQEEACTSPSTVLALLVALISAGSAFVVLPQ